MFTRQNSVQQKVDCLFEIKVEDKESAKRPNQPFRVSASDRLNPEVKAHNLEDALVTEKVDGTCCYVSEFEGKPWLWARHDRKTNKIGDKKLKKYLSEKDIWRRNGEMGDRPAIIWDVPSDFKDVPEHWRPALEVPVLDGVAQPDDHGHIPGWVPVDQRSRQHLWHLAAVKLDKGLGLVLQQSEDGDLCITCVPLSELDGQTVELIGTNVNGNPYKLGTKQQPIHLLVVHGSITLRCPLPVTLASLIEWLEHDDEGRVEGIVWHCSTGALFKLHRHHVNLPWPIERPRLSQKKVKIAVDGSQFEFTDNAKCQFHLMSRHFESTCDHLSQLHDLIYSPPTSKRLSAKIVVPVVIGVVAAPLAVPVVLGAAGFGAGGIIAGSIAARAMSAAAIANGGGVAAGSVIAVCQSIGAAGLGATGTAVAGAVGGVVGGAASAAASWFRSKKGRK